MFYEYPPLILPPKHELYKKLFKMNLNVHAALNTLGHDHPKIDCNTIVRSFIDTNFGFSLKN
jgi:hypothetical protein